MSSVRRAQAPTPAHSPDPDPDPGHRPDAASVATPASPFDAVATRYDAEFSDLRLGRMLRQRVWDVIGGLFHPGDHVLDLGCGTGTDALWLAGRGVRVTSIEASATMLSVARRAASHLEKEAANRLNFVRGDLAELASLELGRELETGVEVSTAGAGGSDHGAHLRIRFDGALSNFGALNCLPDRQGVAAALADRIRPDGRLVLVVMGPYCPWEAATLLLGGHPREAMRRSRGGDLAKVGDASVRVWYPSPRQLRRELSPWFIAERLIGVAAFLPHSGLAKRAQRWGKGLEILARLEALFGGRFPCSWFNDHYLLQLRRRT